MDSRTAPSLRSSCECADLTQICAGRSDTTVAISTPNSERIIAPKGLSQAFTKMHTGLAGAAIL